MPLLLLLVIAVVDRAVLPSQFDQTASEALGMEVSTEGAVNLRFWPNPHIRARQLNLSRDDSRVAAFESVQLQIRLNFQPRELDPDTEVRLPGFTFANISLFYRDERADTRSELAGCDGRAHRTSRAEGDAPKGLIGLEFEGELQCESIDYEDLVFSDVAVEVRGEGGRFEFNPISFTTFGGAGEARFEADYSGDTPSIVFEISLEEFHLDAFLKSLQDAAQAEGTMHFTASLSASGENREAMWQTLEGDISLHGRELQLHGIDLDHREKPHCRLWQERGVEAWSDEECEVVYDGIIDAP